MMKWEQPIINEYILNTQKKKKKSCSLNINKIRNSVEQTYRNIDNLASSRLIYNLISCAGEYGRRRLEEGNCEKERAKDQ